MNLYGNRALLPEQLMDFLAVVVLVLVNGPVEFTNLHPVDPRGDGRIFSRTADFNRVPLADLPRFEPLAGGTGITTAMFF